MITADKKIILRRAPSGGINSESRGYRGGQFIPASIWNAEKAKAAADLPGLIASFADDLQFQREVYEQHVALRALPTVSLSSVKLVTSERIAQKMKSTIRAAYTQSFLLGKRHAGNLTTVNAEDAIAIKDVRLDEYTYLRRFLRDMDNGSGVMDYEKRADYYAKAARELFWLGFILGDATSTRRINWVLGPTEHCKTCLDMAKHGAWKVSDFTKQAKEGILPQSGRLDCLGYACQCRLTDEYVKE